MAHTDSRDVPSRVEVRWWWNRLAEGVTSRAEAHLWAARWVEGGDFMFADSMILTALQYLHGYDMVRDENSGMIVHASPNFVGSFIKPDVEIRADLERWNSNCRLYDYDPDGYRAMMKSEALKMLMNEVRKDEG